MKQLLFLFFAFFFISCENTKEEDFFIKKYGTNEIEILSEVLTDSAYSPHVVLDKLYKEIHKNLNEKNYETLYDEFINARRDFMNPTYNNCIKKTYAIKIKNDEPILHTLYFVQHCGNVCIHDKEQIFRQMIDIDNNFFHYKHDFIENNHETIVDTCKFIIFEKK